MSNDSSNREDFKASVVSVAVSVDIDSAVTWIAQNMEPGDVFDVPALERWAKDNGFSKYDDA